MALRIVAYTSETIGKQVILTDSEDNTITSESPMELLDFIGEPYGDLKRTTPYYELKVAFDLDQFVAPILRSLGISACKQLAGPTHIYNHKDGSVFYIPSKILSIEHKGHRSFIYHLAQYYESEPDPQDPIAIQAMAQNLMDALKNMGLSPLKLTSPVAIYEAEVLRHLQIPTILDLPGTKEEEVIDYAEACIGRLWISAYCIGRWKTGDIWSYDITAAFPFEATQLYSIKYAKFAKLDRIDPQAHWGFLKGIVTINDDVMVSPILRKDGNGNLSNPTGTWPDIITLDEYNFIRKWKLGEFQIEDGWFIKFTAPVRPLNVPLQRLFKLRARSEMASKLAKRMASGGCYGKFLEQHDDGSVGKFYNPLFAAMISTRTRLRVAEFIYQHKLQDNLIHVGVDGLLTTKEVKLRGGTGMGCWKLNGIGPALVISPGRVYTGEKRPQGLNYDDIMAMIKEKPKESHYATKMQRRQTLAECIELGNLKGLGEMKDVSSSLDLNILRAEQDRVFGGFPRNGQELLNNKYASRPIHI